MMADRRSPDVRSAIFSMAWSSTSTCSAAAMRRRTGLMDRAPTPWNLMVWVNVLNEEEWRVNW